MMCFYLCTRMSARMLTVKASTGKSLAHTGGTKLFLCNCGVVTEEGTYMLLLFDDNKVKIARKSGKKQKESPAGCNGEGKR